MLLVDWLSHLTGWSVCWGCHVVSLQIRRWKWGGGAAPRASLLGSSCLLISSEQMEESPHLTGDRFLPTSSNNSRSNLASVWARRQQADVTSSQKVEKKTESPGEFGEDVLDTQQPFFEQISSETQKGATFSCWLSLEFSYLSLLCLHPSVYTHPLHLYLFSPSCERCEPQPGGLLLELQLLSRRTTLRISAHPEDQPSSLVALVGPQSRAGAAPEFQTGMGDEL